GPARAIRSKRPFRPSSSRKGGLVMARIRRSRKTFASICLSEQSFPSDRAFRAHRFLDPEGVLTRDQMASSFSLDYATILWPLPLRQRKAGQRAEGWIAPTNGFVGEGRALYRARGRC